MPTELVPAARSGGKPPREITGRFVLIALILFFGVVATVNFTMMTLATRTFPGADARNGYDVSQGYNREIATARAQAERGWKADVELQRTNGVATLTFRVRDGASNPVSGLAAEARLRHPSDRRQDHVMALSETSAGVYQARENLSLTGAWDVAVTARSQGDKVFSSQSRIILKD
ncbi:MAG TPA: FixH family protein [Beijerinckiaceae bacterium]|nr:FixH family protein [Beijerinckiaceae bacterium]